MLAFNVIDPGGAPINLMPEAGTATVPPLSQFVAEFDRLLDPTALETLAPDGAIGPQAGVGIITWSGGPVDSIAVYTPNGHHIYTLVYPNGPNIRVTPSQGLPSGSTVTVRLDPNKVRSHDQTTSFQPMAGVSTTLMFDTEPLAATVVVPEPVPVEVDAGAGDDGGSDDGGADGGGIDAGPPPEVTPPVEPDFVVHIPFNNQTVDATADQITVAVTVAGLPVADPGATKAREMDSVGWMVSPPDTGWPAGATVTVTVGAGAADYFGQTLGTAVTATFTVKP